LGNEQREKGYSGGFKFFRGIGVSRKRRYYWVLSKVWELMGLRVEYISYNGGKKEGDG